MFTNKYFIMILWLVLASMASASAEPNCDNLPVETHQCPSLDQFPLPDCSADLQQGAFCSGDEMDIENCEGPDGTVNVFIKSCFAHEEVSEIDNEEEIEDESEDFKENVASEEWGNWGEEDFSSQDEEDFSSQDEEDVSSQDKENVSSQDEEEDLEEEDAEELEESESGDEGSLRRLLHVSSTHRRSRNSRPSSQRRRRVRRTRRRRTRRRRTRRTSPPRNCRFVAVPRNQCPRNVQRLPQCSNSMRGNFCQTFRALPGLSNHRVRNCERRNIFERKCGGGSGPVTKRPTPRRTTQTSPPTPRGSMRTSAPTPRGSMRTSAPTPRGSMRTSAPTPKARRTLPPCRNCPDPNAFPWTTEPVLVKPSFDSNLMIIKSDWAFEKFHNEGYVGYETAQHELSRWLCQKKGEKDFDVHMYFPSGRTERRSANFMQMRSKVRNACGDKFRGRMFMPLAYRSGNGPFMHELMHSFIKGKVIYLDGAVARSTEQGVNVPGGHWFFNVLDTQGQVGGFGAWGVYCKTGNGYEKVYPDINKCRKSGGQYDLIYADGAGNPSVSHDANGISDYELVIAGVKKMSELTHKGMIGAALVNPRKVRPVNPSAPLMRNIPTEDCEKWGMSSASSGGCEPRTAGRFGRGAKVRAYKASKLTWHSNAEIQRYIDNTPKIKDKQVPRGYVLKMAPITVVKSNQDLSQAVFDKDFKNGGLKHVKEMGEGMRSKPARYEVMTEGRLNIDTRV